MTTQIIKVPTLADLVQESDESIKENHLMILLNQEPPKAWIKFHPTAKVENEKGEKVPARYLPAERVEYLLSRIFGTWRVEVKDTKLIANSVCVTVRVFVINPVTNQEQWHDGVGASPIQTEKGSGAMDWNMAKSAGVQMALPSAETYAIKDACEKFGKLFGKDLNRKESISYDSLIKHKICYADLAELFEAVKGNLSKDELTNATRILTNKEEASYNKLWTLLNSK